MEQKITVPKGCKIESVEHDDNQIVIMFSEDKNKEQEVISWKDLIGKQIPDNSKRIDAGAHIVNANGKFGLIDKNVFIDERHAKSALAMAQISQLVPLYGGAITDEEWERSDVEKFTICRTLNRISITCYWSGFYLLAFHTKEQRNNFMKYNEQLVKDYLMLD